MFSAFTSQRILLRGKKKELLGKRKGKIIKRT